MPIRPGSYTLGPDNAALQVKTYREGVASKVGHDLVIDVTQWEATVALGEEVAQSRVELTADPRSLHVREGLRGAKPLTDKDRVEIRKNIDEKVLREQPIAFRSTGVEADGTRLTVRGELEIAGTPRPATFELTVDADGRVSGVLPVTQSDFGIKPYRALMGALKVRDAVEVVLAAQLPAD